MSYPSDERIKGRIEAADMITEPYVRLLNEVERLRAENAFLRAEVDRLKPKPTMNELIMYNG